MGRQTRTRQTDEERLQELVRLLNEEQQKSPLDFTARIADLSCRIIRIKKSMGILMQEEQDQLIRSMMEYAFHMKTGEFRDRYAAKNTFEKVLKLDPCNSEANYRYAFLHYEDKSWITAINHFNKALNDNDSAFPLWPDQLIKAHLFIGYCSVELAKTSMKMADDLSESTEELASTGISIEALSTKLQEKLAGTEFVLLSREDRQMISKSEYEVFRCNLDCNEVLLDFTENESFIQRGNTSREITTQNAFLLKKLLLKSVNDAPLPLDEVTGYQEEVIANTHEVTWDNYRRKVSRINQNLAQIGFPKRFIQHVPNTKSYQFPNIHFYIIAREDQSL